MSTGNPALNDLIRARIKMHGPQSFAWFMEQALYHPDHGYYSSDRAAIGRRGDYFTSVSVGPLFGEFLAAQFAEIWERLGKVDRPKDRFAEANNFLIVEQGAHHGQFARDVLESTQRRFPEFFSALRYQIVEPFSALQDRQSETLRRFGDRVQWRKSLDELAPFTGIHFSNELLDAMPINLRGKLVGLDGDKLVFVEGSAGAPNQTMLDWIDCVSRRLQRGFLIAIDYGFSRAEFREVLQVRAKHRRLNSPFEEIGQADITAHVNWTDLAERADAVGLRLVGFTDQHHFITGIMAGFPGLLEKADARTRRELQTLLHPEMLGRTFQVLALVKDAHLGAPLSGFQFARGPREALGL